MKEEQGNVWDIVWKKDSYSDPNLRKLKARKKVDKLFEVMPLLDSHMVLVDVGCGGGYVSSEIYSRIHNKIICIDESNAAIELSKKNLSDLPIDIYHCNGTDIQLGNNIADIVICIGSLEHIQNIDGCIGEIKRILKPGGYLYVVSSNKHSFMYYHRKIKEHLHIWKYGYQKNWSQDELKKYLHSKGLEVVHSEIVNGMGDFKYISFLDSLCSRLGKPYGRYIVCLCKTNE